MTTLQEKQYEKQILALEVENRLLKEALAKSAAPEDEIDITSPLEFLLQQGYDEKHVGTVAIAVGMELLHKSSLPKRVDMQLTKRLLPNVAIIMGKHREDWKAMERSMRYAVVQRYRAVGEEKAPTLRTELLRLTREYENRGGI